MSKRKISERFKKSVWAFFVGARKKVSGKKIEHFFYFENFSQRPNFYLENYSLQLPWESFFLSRSISLSLYLSWESCPSSCLNGRSIIKIILLIASDQNEAPLLAGKVETNNFGQDKSFLLQRNEPIVFPSLGKIETIKEQGIKCLDAKRIHYATGHL